MHTVSENLENGLGFSRISKGSNFPTFQLWKLTFCIIFKSERKFEQRKVENYIQCRIFTHCVLCCVFWTWLRLCIFGCDELHSFVSDLVCCDLVFWGCWLPFAWLTSLMGNGWCHWERSHRFPRRAQAKSRDIDDMGSAAGGDKKTKINTLPLANQDSRKLDLHRSNFSNLKTIEGKNERRLWCMLKVFSLLSHIIIQLEDIGDNGAALLFWLDLVDDSNKVGDSWNLGGEADEDVGEDLRLSTDVVNVLDTTAEVGTLCGLSNAGLVRGTPATWDK